MANYVYIEDGKILEYHQDLPSSWKNISGLNLSKHDINFLINLGWYPVQKTNEIYDPKFSYISGYDYEIYEDHVKEIPQIVDYTQYELDNRLEQTKEIFFEYLRERRTAKLQESDWTQLSDIQKRKSPEWIASWEEYRNQLRDLPEVYQNTTDFNVDVIIFPEQPTI